MRTVVSVTSNYMVGAVLLLGGGKLVKSERPGNRTIFHIETPEDLDAEVTETKRLAQSGGYGLVLDIGVYTDKLNVLRDETKKFGRTP